MELVTLILLILFGVLLIVVDTRSSTRKLTIAEVVGATVIALALIFFLT